MTKMKIVTKPPQDRVSSVKTALRVTKTKTSRIQSSLLKASYDVDTSLPLSGDDLAKIALLKLCLQKRKTIVVRGVGISVNAGDKSPSLSTLIPRIL